MSTEIFILIIMFISSLVQCSTGFGASLVTMATLPMMLTVKDTISINYLSISFTLVYLVYINRKSINFRLSILPMIMSIAGSIVGMFFLINTDNESTKIYLGMIMLVLAVYFVFFYKKIKIFKNNTSAIVTSSISGVMGGFFNIPGPPIVLYFTSVSENKYEYMATTQFVFLITLAVKIMFFKTNGLFNENVLNLLPYGLVGTIAGSLLGFKLFRTIPKEKVSYSVYAIMITAGLFYIIKSILNF